MSRIEIALKNLEEDYTKEGLNLEKAILIWKEAKLSPEKIRQQVAFDIKRNIDSSSSKALYKLGCIAKEEKDLEKYFNIDSRIKNARYIPYSPEVLSRLKRTNLGTFISKEAKVDIEWVLVEKEGSDGNKVMYLARREPKLEKVAMEKSAESKVLIKSIETNGEDSYIFPQGCPAFEKEMNDYLKINQEPCCQAGKENKCKYFVSANQDSSEYKKDITCKVSMSTTPA